MNTNTKFVDLSKYFNTSLDEGIHHKPGNDLKAVPHGINEFAGTLFDAKGLIQLSGTISKERTGVDYPPEAKGIEVNAKGKKISFLQCSSWHDKAGTKIGEYRIHYSNGEEKAIPIIYQGNVVDWWFGPEDKTPSDAVVAWKGDNERTRNQGLTIQLYKYVWDNPLPDVEIKEFDFISDGKESAPFLIAVTIE